MNKILYVILAAFSMISCSKAYDISGSIDTQALDGDKLFLKVSDNGDLKNIDSCDIIHGQFHFVGTLDSVRVASICDDSKEFVPVVLEEGPIKVVINNSELSCTGTALNDTLTHFEKQMTKLTSKMADLQEKVNHTYYLNATNEIEDLDGELAKINKEAATISTQLDDLCTKFVEANYDNCLGPFVFCNRAFSDARATGMVSPWVDALLLKAPEKFKKNKDVARFMTEMQHFKNIQNGTEQPDQAPLQGNVPTGGATATPAALGK